MADYTPSEEVRAVISRGQCSVEELKQSLMRRAAEGRSRHTPEQMELLILWRLSANNITPADRAILDEVNETMMANQPRSVLMLDAFSRHAENAQIVEYGAVRQRTRYRGNTASRPFTVPALLQ